jgi:hypothetical protein
MEEGLEARRERTMHTLIALTRGTIMSFTTKFFDIVYCAALIVGAGCDVSDHSTDEELAWDEELMGPGEGVELIEEVEEVEEVDELIEPDAMYDATCPDPDAEGVSYYSQDREKCAQVSILCAPGWVPIPPECGCGCMKKRAPN